jgi:hypothetical protein
VFDYRTADYAYGVNDCLQLAEGKFDRSKASYSDPKDPLCADSEGNEGLCQPVKSILNADSIMFVALGIYFSQEYVVAIPL